MMTEAEIRTLLNNKEAERSMLYNNRGKKGNKGYRLPYLAVECDLLKEILELK